LQLVAVPIQAILRKAENVDRAAPLIRPPEERSNRAT
jgi:hypothetical protein